MQKSKNATIAIIALILIYGLLATFKLSTTYNIAYLYIINPLCWIALAILLGQILGKATENHRLKKPIIQYTITASLVYIITYMLSGLFVTFGRNPFATNLKGFITNLWILGVAMVVREYVRYKLIHNVYDKDKTTIAILIAVVYVVIDIEFQRFIGTRIAAVTLTKYVAQSILPSIAENILFSYAAMYCSYVPAIIYKITTSLYLWLSPILPNSPWVMTAIIDTVIPVILFLYIRFTKNKLDIYRTRENIINSDPRQIIPLVVVIILVIWFALGIFPIKPLAIASASMEKALCIGDVAIIQKCGPNDVNEGDIIEYQMEGYTVVHRIAQKTQRKGEFYFITKGDNNKDVDAKEVTEDQLIGKVIFKIKYIGYPAIWIHDLQEEEELEVETGDK